MPITYLSTCELRSVFTQELEVAVGIVGLEDNGYRLRVEEKFPEEERNNHPCHGGSYYSGFYHYSISITEPQFAVMAASYNGETKCPLPVKMHPSRGDALIKRGMVADAKNYRPGTYILTHAGRAAVTAIFALED